MTKSSRLILMDTVYTALKITKYKQNRYRPHKLGNRNITQNTAVNIGMTTVKSVMAHQQTHEKLLQI